MSSQAAERTDVASKDVGGVDSIATHQFDMPLMSQDYNTKKSGSPKQQESASVSRQAGARTSLNNGLS